MPAQLLWLATAPKSTRAPKFQPFHQCAVDPARIELDRRLIGDVLGLDHDAQAAVSRLRNLLATEPSIHGSKPPEPAKLR